MLRRRARSRPQKEQVRIGEMRLDVGDLDAPDGTLRVVQDLQPSGPSGAHHWATMMPFTGIKELSEFSGDIVAIGQQSRDKIGDFATYTSASLERYIIVTTSNIYLYADDGQLFSVYTFDSTEPTRKCLFAAVGPMTVLAVSVNGQPSELLQLRDDACFDYNPPDLPSIVAYKKSETASEDALEKGVYAYRYAYEFVDGSLSGVSRPYIIDTKSASLARVRLGFKVASNPVDSNWEKLIRRVVFFMTQQADETALATASYYENLLAGPYYRVTSVSTIAVNEEAEWSAPNAEIVGGESLDDTNLLQHDMTAAAVFGYNQRFLFGDVEFSFANPQLGYYVFTVDGSGESVFPPTVEASATTVAEDGTIYVNIVDPDGDYITSVEAILVSGFTYQVQYLSGSSWINEGAANTDYSDAGGTYLNMRVAITETTAGAGDHNLVVIAQDSDGSETVYPFVLTVT